MHIDWWTIGLQTINAIVLIWLLKRFLLQPVAAIIEVRKVAAEKLFNEAQAAKSEAEDAMMEAQAELSRLAQTQADVLTKANQQAEAAKSALLDDARAQAEQLRKTAEADIARSQAEARKADAVHAKTLASAIAVKLFARLPDDARIAGFIDGLAQVLAELPETERNAIAATAPLGIKAPRLMTAEEMQACTAKLSESLGKSVTLDVAVEPDLIAGLEIDTPHALVRNSFRADLDRIALELSRDDNDR
jgi:F-type H+-transporting ATPase subunit b